MTDYIKREDAIDYLVTNMNWFDADGIETSEEEKRADITELVNGVPSSDVAPVRHGRWMPLVDCSNAGIYCSLCHKKVFGGEYSNTMKLHSAYCPNCGARMDGESDE